MQYGRIALVILVAVLTASCTAAGLGALAAIISSFADGVGDTEAAATPTAYDVTRVISRRLDNSPLGSYDTLQIEVTFAQAVVLPPAGSGPDAAGTQLAFDLGFNTDLNTATGGGIGCEGLGSWSGWDFLVAAEGGGAPFDRLANGNYNVVTPFPFTVTGQATVSVSGTVLTVNVPLSALGGDDGQTHLYTFVGNGNPTAPNTTDCAPDPTGAVITRQGRGGVRR